MNTEFRAKLEQGLINLRDMARAGLKPDAVDYTEEQWLNHKLDYCAGLASHMLALLDMDMENPQILIPGNIATFKEKEYNLLNLDEVSELLQHPELNPKDRERIKVLTFCSRYGSGKP